MARLHQGPKLAWEEFHWDQDVDRWVGRRRDAMPSMRVRPGHQDFGRGPDLLPGLLD